MLKPMAFVLDASLAASGLASLVSAASMSSSILIKQSGVTAAPPDLIGLAGTISISSTIVTGAPQPCEISCAHLF